MFISATDAAAVPVDGVKCVDVRKVFPAWFSLQWAPLPAAGARRGWFTFRPEQP